MKIVFLDVDGVLNYTEWYVSDRNPGNLDGQEADIDPLCAERVNRICAETGAKIVLTSDWRINWPYCIDRIEKGGIEKGLIIDKTPEHIWAVHVPRWYKSRGAEINEWLLNHPECDNYVILDDRTDMAESQMSNFVHVNSLCGLDETDVEFALKILQNMSDITKIKTNGPLLMDNGLIDQLNKEAEQHETELRMKNVSRYKVMIEKYLIDLFNNPEYRHSFLENMDTELGAFETVIRMDNSNNLIELLFEKYTLRIWLMVPNGENKNFSIEKPNTLQVNMIIGAFRQDLDADIVSPYMISCMKVQHLIDDNRLEMLNGAYVIPLEKCTKLREYNYSTKEFSMTEEDCLRQLNVTLI